MVAPGGSYPICTDVTMALTGKSLFSARHPGSCFRHDISQVALSRNGYKWHAGRTRTPCSSDAQVWSRFLSKAVPSPCALRSFKVFKLVPCGQAAKLVYFNHDESESVLLTILTVEIKNSPSMQTDGSTRSERTGCSGTPACNRRLIQMTHQVGLSPHLSLERLMPRLRVQSQLSLAKTDRRADMYSSCQVPLF